jgi:hypothetical protein
MKNSQIIGLITITTLFLTIIILNVVSDQNAPLKEVEPIVIEVPDASTQRLRTPLSVGPDVLIVGGPRI